MQTEETREWALRKVNAVPERADRITRDYALALQRAGEIDVAKHGTNARDRAVEKARTEAEQGIAELRADVEKRTAHAGRWADKQGSGRDTNDALLAETRQGRAWQRTRPLLEAGYSAPDLIAAAQAEGDADTLAAMRAELPSYAAAREDSGAKLTAVGGDAEMPALLRQVDDALAESLPDDQRTALRTRLAFDDAGELAGRALDNAAHAVETYADRPDTLRKALLAMDVDDTAGDPGMAYRGGPAVNSRRSADGDQADGGDSGSGDAA